jgi:hypothetical protein
MQPGLAVVAYAFYPQHGEHLARVVARYATGHAAKVVWVHAASVAARPGWQALPHDGAGWEFGAYQRGLDALQQQGWVGPIAFFNDTAGRHYPLPGSELRALRRFALAAPAARAAVAGHVETAPRGCAWRGLPVPRWVRSNAFVLSPAALQALNGRLFDGEEFAAPRWAEGTLAWPAHLSTALHAHLDRWLMSPGKHGWRHHAGRPDAAPELLCGKAGSILLEKRMAALVLAAGGTLLPSTGQGMLQRLRERAFFARRRLGRWRSEALV